jgi:hypothetical protein
MEDIIIREFDYRSERTKKEDRELPKLMIKTLTEVVNIIENNMNEIESMQDPQGFILSLMSSLLMTSVQNFFHECDYHKAILLITGHVEMALLEPHDTVN